MAGYKYEFDHTKLGDARYEVEEYRVIHDALELLQRTLQSWNNIARENGALTAPYGKETRDIQGMINWARGRLSDSATGTLLIPGLSIGSARYIKAALIHAAWFHDKQINEKAKHTWPTAVAEVMRGRVRRYYKFAEDIKFPPAAILDELRSSYGMNTPPEAAAANWDVFISHASEDKNGFARPLAEGLQACGLRVWYDEFTLTVGDSLRRSIDRGLAHSKFGVVLLSEKFFEKEWPQKELDGLVAREVQGKKVILPVWHGVTADDVRRFSPMLADRVAISSTSGIPAVVEALIAAMRS